MSEVVRLSARIVGALLLSFSLMLPTIVGALSDPASPRQAELVCPDESDPQTDPDTEDFAPRIDTVAACIELLPEETTPEDDPQAASAHETRMAANDRLREEAP